MYTPSICSARLLRARAVPMALALLAAGSQASAQSKESAMAADAMQTASEKALLLRAPGAPTNETGMDEGAFKTLVSAIEQKRFDVRSADPNADEIVGSPGGWCSRSAESAARKNDDTDTKGEGRVSTEAWKARCSEVYQYALTGRHACKPAKKNEQECSVSVAITVTKFAAADQGGRLVLSKDTSFGRGGETRITSSGTSTSRDPRAAQRNAAFSARLFAEREVRDIEYFQARAPLTDANRSTSSFCLSRDILELDQPFHILKLDENDKKVRVGFAKVREMYDGCVQTKDLEEREQAGEKIQLRPTKLQNILGGDAIRTGMTAWEMPSVGLNWGLKGGVSTIYGGDLAPRIDLVVEYNLARHTGISELHAAMHAGWVGYGEGASQALSDKLGWTSSQRSGSPIGAQYEVGLLKRAYFGALSLEGGVFAAGSYLRLGSIWNYDVNAVGYVGAAGKVGVGFQMSPRFALRLDGGFRWVALEPQITETISGAEYSGTKDLGSEQGALGSLGFLYTY